MENEKDLFDEVYDNALMELDKLEPGSEEYERQAKAISDMLKAKSEQMKAETDAKSRTSQVVATLIQAGVGILTVGASILGIMMQRKTNKDVMSYEEDDVITSKAFDNKTKFR